MAPFMGVSGLGGPGSALGKYTPDPRLSDTYWIASLETQGGIHAVSTHSTPDRNQGRGIAVDNADGSVYVCGHEVRGYGTYSQRYKNLYLTKFDKAGTLQWQRLVGYNHYTSYPGVDLTEGEGRAVVVDSNSDVYVFGDGIIDVRYHSSFGYNADVGVLMAKYNSSGDIIWQRHAGGRHGPDEVMSGVLIDDGDNIYLPLITKSIGYVTASSGFQMMYSVMNTDGVQQYARVHYDTRTGVTQGSVNYAVAGVEKDSSNNMILVGHTDGQANLQGAFGGTVVKWAAGTEGSTTAPKFKYAIFYQDGYGTHDVKVYSVAKDSSDNLYVAGTIIYSQGHAASIPEEAFICQVPYNVPETIFNTDVTGFWCKRFRYTGTEKLRSTFENGQIRVDSDDNIVAVGSVTKISSGEKQYLIMKLDSSGNEIWTRTLDTFRTSTGNSGIGIVEDSGAGLAIDNRNNIYVSGTYARGSDKGTMIAKLPGDGSLYDFQKGTPSSLSKIIHGGRYRYSNNDGTGSNTYSYYYDEIGGAAGYYRMKVNNQSGNVNDNNNHITGYIFHGVTTMYTGIGSMGHTVSVLHDVTPSTASYDYSFPDEVYYGDGTVGSGTTISLGTQNYHYSGDGTMPAVGLGTVQNWDMFFELKRGKLDVDANSSSGFAIGNSGYTQTDGFMLQFEDNFIASAGLSAKDTMTAYNGGNQLRSLMPASSTNPISTEETRPMSDDWNWFKLEWRGGTSFKIWHKKTPTGNYANLFTSTDSSLITNQTNWDYISIGQTKQHPNFGLQSSNQFYGRIRNFGLNVNSNVVDLSDNRNITDHKLLVHIDASNPNSYSGIGSTCNNLARLVGIVTDTRNVYSGPGDLGLRGSYSYSDVGIWTGSGLDGAGVTTSLSNHTTLNGVPVFTNLRAYSTIRDLAYNESNTYVGPFQTKDFSYSIWCYPLATDIGTFRRLINHYEYGNYNEGYSLVIDYSGYLALRTRFHGTETSSYYVSANNWYNICVVHSVGSTIDFYVNGIKRHTGTTTWPYNYSFDTISIGGVGITTSSNASEAVWTNGGYYYENFDGPIASVAYYGRRLYESEIESNYNRNCSKYGLPYMPVYNTSG